MESQSQLAAARSDRENADKGSLQSLLKVVNSVEGDPEYGDNIPSTPPRATSSKWTARAGLSQKTSAVMFPVKEESPQTKAA
ncbi:MAG: hypothetical protein EXS36_19610 [Pedosphaera sp.]|nr:hypothetical protein [Pedosphaera sp.]